MVGVSQWLRCPKVLQFAPKSTFFFCIRVKMPQFILLQMEADSKEATMTIPLSICFVQPFRQLRHTAADLKSEMNSWGRSRALSREGASCSLVFWKPTPKQPTPAGAPHRIPPEEVESLSCGDWLKEVDITFKHLHLKDIEHDRQFLDTKEWVHLKDITLSTFTCFEHVRHKSSS